MVPLRHGVEIRSALSFYAGSCACCQLLKLCSVLLVAVPLGSNLWPAYFWCWINVASGVEQGLKRQCV